MNCCHSILPPLCNSQPRRMPGSRRRGHFGCNSSRLTPSPTSVWNVRPQADYDVKMDPETTKRIQRLKFAQKILYFLVVLVLVVGLIAQTAQCLHKYAQKPTYTETQVVRQQESQFPAFTFCREGGSYKADMLKVLLLINNHLWS